MSEFAVNAMLRGAGKAGRRFMADVAVSAMATLCVTLVVSLWPRQDGSSGAVSAPAITTAPATAPLATPPAAEIVSTMAAGTITAGATVHDDAIGATSRAAPVSIAPVPPVHGRLPHPPRATAHGASTPCGTSCGSRASTSAAVSSPAPQLAATDPLSVALVTRAETDQPRSVFGVPVPSLAVPEFVVRSVGPVLQGANSVTRILVRKW